MGDTHQLTPTPTLPKGNTHPHPPKGREKINTTNYTHSTNYRWGKNNWEQQITTNHNTLLCDVVHCCLNRTANYAHYFRQRDKWT